jgi:nitrogen fixation protein FixH
MEPFTMSCCGVNLMPCETAPISAKAPAAPRPITGRFVLFACMGFFGIVFGVNAIMMTLAIRTMPGLDVKNGYVASQAMNREMDAMRAQSLRGWTADMNMALKDGTGPIRLSLRDRSGNPVTALDVTARLAHPALTAADHVSVLVESKPGIYTAEFQNLRAGAWTIVIKADLRGEHVFVSRNRVLLMEPAS